MENAKEPQRISGHRARSIERLLDKALALSAALRFPADATARAQL
jgi:hypothetical protein